MSSAVNLLPVPAILARDPLDLDAAAPSAGDGSPAWWKSVFDSAAAAVLFVLTAPVVLVAALAVKLTSPGPAFYSQVRLGANGRRFTIWKLRSMRHDCEAVSGIRWSAKGDPRVTPVGRFLRASHIDELPQLWNVLRGEMSLVGPRPERPELAVGLARAIPGYYDRLKVKPGVTGLAQVLLPPDTDLESVRRKLAMDLHYVDGFGPLLELRVLAGTVLHLFKVPGRTVAKLLGLPRPPEHGE